MASLFVGVIAGFFALVFAAALTVQVMRKGKGNEVMQEIAKAIQEGSSAFLRREYLFLAIFVVAVTVDVRQAAAAITWVVPFVRVVVRIPPPFLLRRSRA